MIDIKDALYNILHSRYGRDVRQSIHDGIYQINENANEAVQTAKAMGVGTDISSPTASSTGYVAGNLYLNNSTWDLWQCIGTDSWVNKGNIKGETGVKGADGINYYIHIRYSDKYDGTGFTASPTASSQYMGVYYGTSQTAPTNKQDYQWASYVGASGTSAYVHIMYSENADGTGFVSIPTPLCKYIGFYSGPLSSPPANKSYYTWSEYVGKSGTGSGDMTAAEYAPSGIYGKVDNAINADNATNATNATNADNATNAVNATNATTATNATNASNLKKSDGTTVDADTITTKLSKVDNKIDKPTSATEGQVLTYRNNEWVADDSQGGGQFVIIIVNGETYEGQTVTATKGTKSKSAVITSGVARIPVDEGGVWTLTLSSGKTRNTPNMTYYGEYEVSLVPTGSTVTPTDDIQIWLECAELNKSYTTLNQVLADTNTLSALISDNNASDYLARSTTWASDVCSNESAMTYIGLNDYCANKLLADSTWLETICNSAYFEKVLNALVLPMTSNTQPSGYEASSSSSSLNNSALPYMAFDGSTDASSEWAASDGSLNNSYIQIKIKNAKVIKLIKIDMDYRVSAGYYKTGIFDLLASNTGDFNGEEVNLTPNHLTLEKTNSKYSINEMINNNTAYQYYRIKTIQYNCTYSKGYSVLNNVQFYGR